MADQRATSTKSYATFYIVFSERVKLHIRNVDVGSGGHPRRHLRIFSNFLIEKFSDCLLLGILFYFVIWKV